ncbi:hypothetical protein KKF84_15705 [Myxococcota bacterium]|nr:hypothetical protein [Myxococcota bacterium]MBU1536770.1 hypothetical protein [Myxococcota bacterium]
MKTFLFSIFAITLLASFSVQAQTWCASSNCEWSTSDSALEFTDSLTNESDGILHENWPVYSWSIAIFDSDKFDDLMGNVYYFKNFIANRVREICVAKRTEWGFTDMATCDSARTYIRNSYLHKYTGSTMDEALTDTFWTVDEDNWFSYASFNAKSEAYVQDGTKRVYVTEDFWHQERLVRGNGCEMDHLPIVVDLDEMTITFISSELFD